MARLIDVDALDEKLEALMEKHAAMGHNRVVEDYNFVLAALYGVPTVDAVEVVRCKDCVWYEKGENYVPYCNNYASLMDHVTDDTFCSYGQRREDNATD